MMIKLRISRNMFLFVLFFVHNIVAVVMAVSDAANHINDVSTDHQQLDRMIKDALQSSEQTLKAYEQISSTTPIEAVESERIDHLHNISDQVAQLETTRDQLINNINSQQMKKLQERLENTFLTVLENYTALVTDNRNIHVPITTAPAVTITELERRFVTDNLLAESETILSEWIRSIITKEINELDATLLTSSVVSNQRHSMAPSSPDTSKKCIPVETAAEKVYSRLMKYWYDGIGLMDYTHSIVHQYTSPTYMVTDDDLPSTSTLSTVCWNRYIPQDWEYLLPHGWQSWKEWSFNLPDHIYHSLGRWSWGRSTGHGAACAPPEAILQSSTLPGQCWPVAMIVKPAVVTIRLQPSIVVSAISIDHMSKSFVSQFRQQLNSTPKRVVVYGYSPCSTSSGDSSDINCHGIGFDLKTKTLLTEFTYDIEGENNVQTFPIGKTSNDGAARKADTAEDSCSATVTSKSCSAQHSGVSAAVTLEILDNWGNEDYTCLYRIRVHGEPVH